MLKRLREKLDLSEKDHKKMEVETKMKLDYMSLPIKGSMNPTQQ